MPNRIIRESIWTSPNFNDLSAEAERHFYRTLLLADDFGCYESSPQAVKGRCYPLKESISTRDIDLWQQELINNDLILTWDSNSRKYSVFMRFPTHNYLRSLHRRKTPPPPDHIIRRLLQVEPNWEATLSISQAQNYTTEMLWADHDYMDSNEWEFSSDNPEAVRTRLEFFNKKYSKQGPANASKFYAVFRFLTGPADDWEEDNEDLAVIILESYPDVITDGTVDPVKVRAKLK